MIQLSLQMFVLERQTRTCYAPKSSVSASAAAACGNFFLKMVDAVLGTACKLAKTEPITNSVFFGMSMLEVSWAPFLGTVLLLFCSSLPQATAAGYSRLRCSSSGRRGYRLAFPGLDEGACDERVR